MKCAWQAYLNLLPIWVRQDVNILGEYCLEQLHIRLGQAPELVLSTGRKRLKKLVEQEDISFIIHVASEYSPWRADTIGQGYLTASGGHRIGICGESVIASGKMTGISNPTSLCLRVARDFEGIAQPIQNMDGSILIIGAPGCGKTTLLRDLIRQKSALGQGSVSVVDERQELFPLHKGQACFSTGTSTDVLSGCPKAIGIDAVLRSMSPTWIAVDEITAETDCEALLHAGWCGVNLIATAHAGSLEDLHSRPLYQNLLQCRLFRYAVVLQRDKTWTIERL